MSKILSEKPIKTIISSIYDGQIEYDKYNQINIRVSESNRLHLRSIDCEDFMEVEIKLFEINFTSSILVDTDVKYMETLNNVIPVVTQLHLDENNDKVMSVITLGDMLTTPSLLPNNLDINLVKFDLYIIGETSTKNPFKSSEIPNTDNIDIQSVINDAEREMLK